MILDQIRSDHQHRAGLARLDLGSAPTRLLKVQAVPYDLVLVSARLRWKLRRFRIGGEAMPIISQKYSMLFIGRGMGRV